jgi:hypothetical protein
MLLTERFFSHQNFPRKKNKYNKILEKNDFGGFHLLTLEGTLFFATKKSMIRCFK